MKEEQNIVNNADMSRRNFLKRTVLAGAAICIAPTLEKVTAAERVIDGKSVVPHTAIPAGIAAVRTQRTLGSGKAAFTVSSMGYGCMGLNHNRSQYPSKENENVRRHHPRARRYKVQLVRNGHTQVRRNKRAAH